MPVSLPVLQNPVITYSAAKQNHQKDCVTVALINPKDSTFPDQFLGVFVGKGNKTLLIRNRCTLHPMDVNNCISYKDVNNCTSYKDMESSRVLGKILSLIPMLLSRV